VLISAGDGFVGGNAHRGLEKMLEKFGTNCNPSARVF